MEVIELRRLVLVDQRDQERIGVSQMSNRRLDLSFAPERSPNGSRKRNGALLDDLGLGSLGFGVFGCGNANLWLR